MLTTSYHIIVADDEPALRGLIARVVARTLPTVTISSVGSGTEALHVFLQHGADLLITDNDMPGLSGISLTRAVRAQHATVPIVMVSAERQVAAVALAAGVTAFVEKPFTVAELAAVLRTLLALP
jgi:two-component system, chemotaxis family, chemotaxis protein CheY